MIEYERKKRFQKGEAMEYEVFEYNGVGYDRTMHFGEWRVAFLNYAERFDKIDKLATDTKVVFTVSLPIEEATAALLKYVD